VCVARVIGKIKVAHFLWTTVYVTLITYVVTWIKKDDELEAGVFTGIKAQCSDPSHELRQLITHATEADTNQYVEWQHVTRHLTNNNRQNNRR